MVPKHGMHCLFLWKYDCTIASTISQQKLYTRCIPRHILSYYRTMYSKPMTSTGTRVQLNRVRADLVLGGSAWNIHYRGADNQKHNHTTIILSTPLQFNKTLSFLAAPNIPIPSNAAYFIFIGPRSDQSLLMSLTD